MQLTGNFILQKQSHTKTQANDLTICLSTKEAYSKDIIRVVKNATCVIPITKKSKRHKHPNFIIVTGVYNSNYFIMFKLWNKRNFDSNFALNIFTKQVKNKLYYFENPIEYFYKHSFVFLKPHTKNYPSIIKQLKEKIKFSPSSVFELLTKSCVIKSDINDILSQSKKNSILSKESSTNSEQKDNLQLPIFSFFNSSNTAEFSIINEKDIMEKNVKLIRKIFRRYRQKILKIPRYEKSVTQYFKNSALGNELASIFNFSLNTRDAGLRNTRKKKRCYSRRLKKGLEKRSSY